MSSSASDDEEQEQTEEQQQRARYYELLGAACSGDLRTAKRLVEEQHVDVNYHPVDGGTPLIKAASHGKLEMARWLLEKGADVNGRALDGFTQRSTTPLIAAARATHLDVVELLVENGADLTRALLFGDGMGVMPCEGVLAITEYLVHAGAAKDSKDLDFPLLFALGQPVPKLVRYLLWRGARIDGGDPREPSPLERAAGVGILASAEALVRYGADVNGGAEKTGKPLKRALGGRRLEMVRYLLSEGAETDADDELAIAALTGDLTRLQQLLEGRGLDTATAPTLMQCAASQNHVDVLEWLLDNGADVDASETMWTPLATAAYNGQLEAVELLIDRNADTNARMFIDPLIQGASHSLALFEYFRRKGLGRESMSKVLQTAARNGHVDVVRRALELRGHIESTGWAVDSQKDTLPVVEFLCDSGANVNAVDMQGNTALLLAVEAGDLATVEFLCARGADVNVRNAVGETALSLAAMQRWRRASVNAFLQSRYGPRPAAGESAVAEEGQA